MCVGYDHKAKIYVLHHYLCMKLVRYGTVTGISS